MSLKVRPWFYRLLWIAVAAIGAICALGLIPLFILDEGMTVISGRSTLILAGIAGAIMFVYALRRLLWPLKAPPQE